MVPVSISISEPVSESEIPWPMALNLPVSGSINVTVPMPAIFSLAQNPNFTSLLSYT